MFTDSLSIIVMTVKISIYDHVFKASEPEIVEYSSVAEWILDNKKRLVNFAVFNGQPSNETDITKNVNALMSNTGEYVVLISPALLRILFQCFRLHRFPRVLVFRYFLLVLSIS